MDEARPAEQRAEGVEGRGAFGGFIGPRTLLDQVRNTAPYLFDESIPDLPPLRETRGDRLDDHGRHALGWWSILRHADSVAASPEPTPSERTDYFALCVAAHFATVATFVPTDVDTKIRDHFWFMGQPPAERERMRDFVLAVEGWDVGIVSRRVLDVEGIGRISGHDGERLSILAGGMLGFLKADDTSNAAVFEEQIESELAREARAFSALAARGGGEIRLLELAAVMTHNAGDVDQGLSAHRGKSLGPGARERFARLAHERPERYGGAFARAAALYRDVMATEGHRNYPLREIRALRKDPALLLPIGPFLDDWGALLARYPAWSLAERAEVIAGVVAGCRRVKGQMGYYRALAGFDRAWPGGLEGGLGRHLPSGARKELKDSTLRQQLAIRKESFESSLVKRARAILERR